MSADPDPADLYDDWDVIAVIDWATGQVVMPKPTAATPDQGVPERHAGHPDDDEPMPRSSAD